MCVKYTPITTADHLTLGFWIVCVTEAKRKTKEFHVFRGPYFSHKGKRPQIWFWFTRSQVQIRLGLLRRVKHHVSQFSASFCLSVIELFLGTFLLDAPGLRNAEIIRPQPNVNFRTIFGLVRDPKSGCFQNTIDIRFDCSTPLANQAIWFCWKLFNKV